MSRSLSITGTDLVRALGGVAASTGDAAARRRAEATARELNPDGRAVVRILRRGSGRYAVFAARDPVVS